MKKLIILVTCIAVLAVGYKLLPTEIAGEIKIKVQEWTGQAREATGQWSEQLSEQLAVQEWEPESSYDIDTAGWFESDSELLNGSLEYTQLSTAPVEQLILAAAGCKVLVIPTQEREFYYSFENMKKVQAYQREQVLYLKALRDTTLEQDSGNSVLQLYVPETVVLKSADIELGAGSMEFERLCAEKLEFSVGAGKLTVDSLEVTDVSVTLGAGVIDMNDVICQNAEMNVGAGSLTLTGQIMGDIKADCTAGNLKMNLAGAAQDYDYKLQCVAGNLQLGEEKYAGLNEEKNIANNAGRSMELKCAMGNLKVVFQ